MKNKKQNSEDLFTQITSNILDSSETILPSAGIKEFLELLKSIIEHQQILLSKDAESHMKKISTVVLSRLIPLSEILTKKLMCPISIEGEYQILAEKDFLEPRSKNTIDISIERIYRKEIGPDKTECSIYIRSDDWDTPVNGLATADKDSYNLSDIFSKKLSSRGIAVDDIVKALHSDRKGFVEVSLPLGEKIPYLIELVRRGINDEGYDIYTDNLGFEYILADKMYRAGNSYVEVTPMLGNYVVVNNFTTDTPMQHDCIHPLGKINCNGRAKGKSKK